MQDVELVVTVAGSILSADPTELNWMLKGPVYDQLKTETQAVLDVYTDSHGNSLWRVVNVRQDYDPDSIRRVNESQTDVEVSLSLEFQRGYYHPVLRINHLSEALRLVISRILGDYFRKSHKLSINLELRELTVSRRTYTVEC